MKHLHLVDHSIPLLQSAIDPSFMKNAFSELLAREYPDRKLTVSDCRINHIYHKPGKACRIIYSLEGHDGLSNQAFKQWFFAKTQAGTMSEHPQVHDSLNSWPGCGFWKPLTPWPEMNMTLQAFPYDAKMPYLGQLLESDFIKSQISANLAGFGLTKEWKCCEVKCSRVKHMPGKRCVLKYDSTFEDSHHCCRQLTFYGKTYNSPRRSQKVYNVLCQICNSSAFKRQDLNVPAPIAHIDTANTFWQMEWDGSNLSKYIAKNGITSFCNSILIQRIAQWLASFHQLNICSEIETTMTAHEVLLRHAREDAYHICEFMPDKCDCLQNEIDQLESKMQNLRMDVTATLIHGTFKVAQILCHEDEIALVDYDSVRKDDPHLDISEFLASLLYLHFSHNISPQAIVPAIEAFLNYYQQKSKRHLNFCCLSWQLVVFLLAKIHSSLKRMEEIELERVSEALRLIDSVLHLKADTQAQFLHTLDFH